MLTTRRRFASASFFLASISPCSIRCAKSTSSSAVKSGTFPISFKYIRTGSSMLTPSGIDKSIFSISSSSGTSPLASISKSKSSSASGTSPSGIRSTSTPSDSRNSMTFSVFSSSSTTSFRKLLISESSSTFLFDLASCFNAASFSRNLCSSSAGLSSFFLLPVLFPTELFAVLFFVTLFISSSAKKSPAVCFFSVAIVFLPFLYVLAYAIL